MTSDTQQGALVGRVVGDFQLVSLLGAGGMAEVYRARDLRSTREVAIKILPEELAQDLSYVHRFRTEAQRVSALNHPNVVKVYYFGEDAGRYYLVMPAVPESLRDRMDRVGVLAPLEAARIAIQVAAALDAAHAQGLVHRDVKPENILLDEHDTAMLTDFGIARELDVLRDATTTRTPAVTGLPVGTPEYMSPEQLRGGVADQRMDVYALGAVLYEMLTGRVPHQAETPHEVAIKALTERILAPTFFNRVITPELEHVMLTALAQEQRDRYPNMRSFAAALHRALLERATGSGPMAEALAALGPLPSGPSLPTRQLDAGDPRTPPPDHAVGVGPRSGGRRVGALGLPSSAPSSGSLFRKHPVRRVAESPARATAASPPPSALRTQSTYAANAAESRLQESAIARATPGSSGSGARTAARSRHDLQPARAAETARDHRRTRHGIPGRIALACAVLLLAVVAFGGLAVTGNLPAGLGLPGLPLRFFPHATPAASTATLAPSLTVQPMSVHACTGGSFRIHYLGAPHTMSWSATAPTGVTLTPSSGTLKVGVASPPVSISASHPASGRVIVTLAGSQLTASVAVTC